MTYPHSITGPRARRASVRGGAFLQLAAFTAVAATFVASLSRTMWRESRPGCARGDLVFCTGHQVDVAARWPAAVTGILLASVVVMTTGRVYRVAQILELLVVTAGTALFVADQARSAGGTLAICRPGAGGDCAFSAWHVRHLVVGLAVGLALGLVTLALEAAGRRTRVRGPGLARAAGNVLVVASVPVLVVGLLAYLYSRPDDRSGAVLWLLAAGVVFAAGQSLRLSRLSRPVAWGR